MGAAPPAVWPLLLAAFAVCAGTLLRWPLHQRPLEGVDDANIYFTYARNLAAGHGFVFHPGGERVEGVTSPAWAALCALSFLISSAPEPLLLAASLALVIAAVFLCLRLAGDTVGGHSLILAAGAALAPGFLEWTVLSRLETGLWTLALTGLITALARRIEGARVRGVALWLGLLALTRPESLAWGLFFCAALVVAERPHHPSAASAWRAAARPALAFASTVALLTAARAAYFGYALPNTYYAKVSANLADNVRQGALYAAAYLRESPLAAVAATAALLSLPIVAHGRARGPLPAAARVQLLLAGAFAFGLALPLATGGDHFRQFRMYQPLTPVALLLVLNVRFWRDALGDGAARALLARLPAAAATLALAAGVAGPGRYLLGREPPPLAEEFDLARRGRAQGELLNRLFLGHPKPTVAAVAVGGLAFTYEGPILDLMGLNHVRMAHADRRKKGLKNHASFNRAVFYEAAPHMFVGEPVGDPNAPAFPRTLDEAGLRRNTDTAVLQSLFFQTRFLREYQPVVISPSRELHYRTFARTRWIDELSRSGFEVVVLKRAG